MMSGWVRDKESETDKWLWERREIFLYKRERKLNKNTQKGQNN